LGTRPIFGEILEVIKMAKKLNVTLPFFVEILKSLLFSARQ